MENLQLLCNAIIMQATKDFRTAARRLKKHPDDATAQANMAKLEHFFLSDWFSVLTSANGEHILNRLRKEVA